MIVNRCCIACKTRKPKSELIRIVSDKNGNSYIDEKQKVNSRGMYICKDNKCVDKILKMILKNKYKCSIKCDISNLEELLHTIY